MERNELRATLKPYWRKDRKKWFARGYVPIKLTDNTLTRRRVELSLEVKTKASADAECTRLNEDYVSKAQGPIYKTFARAAYNYMRSGGDANSISEVMLNHLGTMQCRHIDDSIMIDLVDKIYPEKKPSAKTINRWIYTPVIAVLRQACKGEGWTPQISRPKGIKKKVKPKPPQNDSWFSAILPFCRPELKALILLLTLHGRRLSEPLKCTPKDFSPQTGHLVIGKDKNGDPLRLDLASPVTDAICAIPGWKDQRYLFGCGPNSQSSIRRSIKLACKKAGVDYYSPHALGRHAFAKRMLDDGESLQLVKEAGHWKTIEVVSHIYGHLESTEVDKKVKEKGAMWGQKHLAKPSPKVITLKKQRDGTYDG